MVSVPPPKDDVEEEEEDPKNVLVAFLLEETPWSFSVGLLPPDDEDCCGGLGDVLLLGDSLRLTFSVRCLGRRNSQTDPPPLMLPPPLMGFLPGDPADADTSSSSSSCNKNDDKLEDPTEFNLTLF